MKVVNEDLIHAVIGASGSSTAYAFMFIEAIADGAVRAGMPKNIKAYKFAAQGVLGAAKMVLETDKHPGELNRWYVHLGNNYRGCKSIGRRKI